MKRVGLVVLVLVLPVLAVLGQGKDDPKKDAERLEGTWLVVESERNGQKQPEEQTKKLKMIFNKDRYIIQVDENTKEATFTIDPTKKPKTIDVVPLDGEDKGKTIPGIYMLDGDKLKLCFADKTPDRPKEFTGKADSKAILFVLQKAK